jgi:hypothetical protein
MIRIATICLAVLALMFVSVPLWAAPGPQEGHFEGFTRNTNPNIIPGTIIDGRGLVTATFPPLVSNFNTNEYTWELVGLVSQGSVYRDSSYVTVYTCGPNSTFTIYEDPLQDARPAYYLCPNPNPDGVYNNGTVYLKGHFVSYKTTFDVHTDTYGVGTFTATVNWDSGTHLGDLPVGQRGAWQFGGTSTDAYSCIPVLLNYEEAMTGIIYRQITPATGTTWGRIRNLYR